MKRLLIGYLLAAVLLLFGGEIGNTLAQPLAVTPTPHRVYLPVVMKDYSPTAVVSTTVDPTQGGQLTSPNGRVQLDFPPGAASESTIVTYTQKTAPSQSTDSLAFACTSFDISATDTDGNPVTNFSQTFNMMVAYADRDWQSAGITDETTLNVYWWDGAAWNALVPCPGCSHNTDDNEFVILLDHLTEFALLGSSSPTPTSTNTPTPTYTPTNTPTPTPTDTPGGPATATPTATETPGGAPTATPTPTETATGQPTATPTNSPTATPTGLPTATPTSTPTVTATPTQTPTVTPTSTLTATATPTNTPTPTVTPTSTPIAIYEGNQITLDPVARVWNGCSTAFWVKPLGGGGLIFVTVDFLTLGGDEILFVGDWVGSGSWFDLDDIADLGSGYCGRAVIETHEDVAYPGPPLYEPVRVEVETACNCP